MFKLSGKNEFYNLMKKFDKRNKIGFYLDQLRQKRLEALELNQKDDLLTAEIDKMVKERQRMDEKIDIYMMMYPRLYKESFLSLELFC